MRPRPSIHLRAGLADGPAVVAAAHASLAWQLRCAGLGFAEVMELPFAPGEIEFAPTAELEAVATGPHLRMTESTLGGQLVAIVRGRNEDHVIERPVELQGMVVDPVVAMHLRMYVLLLAAPLAEQVARAATATVQCFGQYRCDHHMRQWAAGVFVKTVCRVNEAELVRALQEPGGSSVRDADGRLLGAAFCPRPSWPRCFRYFALLR